MITPPERGGTPLHTATVAEAGRLARGATPLDRLCFGQDAAIVSGGPPPSIRNEPSGFGYRAVLDFMNCRLYLAIVAGATPPSIPGNEGPPHRAFEAGITTFATAKRNGFQNRRAGGVSSRTPAGFPRYAPPAENRCKNTRRKPLPFPSGAREPFGHFGKSVTQSIGARQLAVALKTEADLCAPKPTHAVPGCFASLTPGLSHEPPAPTLTSRRRGKPRIR